MDEHLALKLAVSTAVKSPCKKSKRGVVVFRRHVGVVSQAYNRPPAGYACAGTEECEQACGKICLHAEHLALQAADVGGCELLHVKVDTGDPVPGGPPSCWQCSREIVHKRISTVWLLYEEGLRGYSAQEFHEETLKNCGLPIIRAVDPSLRCRACGSLKSLWMDDKGEIRCTYCEGWGVRLDVETKR